MKISRVYVGMWLLLVFTVNGLIFVATVMIGKLDIPNFTAYVLAEVLGGMLLLLLLTGGGK